MRYKVSNIVEKTWNDKKFISADLVDEAGVAYENVGFWAGEVTPETTEIEGDLGKNDKGYWRLTIPKKTGGRPNMDRVLQKKADLINEAQEKKAENISRAQDRTAWMWAKNNAVELYSQDRIGSKLDNEDEALAKIHSIATKIYHMEPTPF